MHTERQLLDRLTAKNTRRIIKTHYHQQSRPFYSILRLISTYHQLFWELDRDELMIHFRSVDHIIVITDVLHYYALVGSKIIYELEFKNN